MTSLTRPEITLLRLLFTPYPQPPAALRQSSGLGICTVWAALDRLEADGYVVYSRAGYKLTLSGCELARVLGRVAV